MDVPIRACETQLVAPDTHLVRQLGGEGVNPVAIFINSMVITGAEPVIVDTGPSITRSLWLEHAFSVVDPADVKWVYLSHDDGDHVGNLTEVLDRCPNAKVVATWFMCERMMADAGIQIPMDRVMWVNDGESFFAGDREFVAVIPPTFDSPTTRGLFDPKTGVYWASDSFGTVVPNEVADMSELDADFLREGFLQVNRMVSPWHAWLDQSRYQAHLDRVRALGATTITSAHGPAIYGEQIDVAFDLLAELPSLPAAPLPGQAELEMMVAAIAA